MSDEQSMHAQEPPVLGKRSISSGIADFSNKSTEGDINVIGNSETPINFDLIDSLPEWLLDEV